MRHGDVITFIASVTNLENAQETKNEQNQIIVIEGSDDKEDENNNEIDKMEDKSKNNETESGKSEEAIEAENSKISENTDNNKEDSNNQEKTNNEKENSEKVEKNSNQKGASKTSSKSENNQGSSKSSSSSASSSKSPNSSTSKSSNSSTSKSQSLTEETVTYSGSNNNYLTGLSVDGYSLNKEFSKENCTYFVNIDTSISSVNINAEKEDDTATVCIYGNEELKVGTNKILVNVTAENGNVRTYRIYITIKA